MHRSQIARRPSRASETLQPQSEQSQQRSFSTKSEASPHPNWLSKEIMIWPRTGESFRTKLSHNWSRQTNQAAPGEKQPRRLARSIEFAPARAKLRVARSPEQTRARRAETPQKRTEP